MTLDEFLAWDPRDPTGATWQLIDGEPMAMAPGSHAHAAMQGEIARLLGNHLVAHGSRCHVVTDPGIVPRVRANRNYRVPDLGVTCAPASNEPMVTEPILLIEILSPSNEAATRSNIWAYTTIPSVREILAVRSTRIDAQLLIRGADGTWPAEPTIIGREDEIMLSSIDYAAPIAAFYRTTALAAQA